MTDQTVTARRRALKILGGAPMLPLGAAAATLAGGMTAMEAALAAPARRKPAVFASATFTGMAAPSLDNPAAMANTTVGSSLTVSYRDGTSQSYTLAYQPFFVTGDMVPDGRGGKVLAGGYYDIQNRPIVDDSVPGKSRQFYSDAPDGSSLLTLGNARVPGVRRASVWITVQRRWVYLQGCVPSAGLARRLERAAKAVPDVELVAPDLMQGTRGRPPYPVPAPP